MPVRLLRPTLRTSERWHRSTYFDRCLYISLLNLVDDYGRYEANACLLASECFPYGGEDGLPVTASAIDGGLRSLASKDLLLVYESQGNRYVQLTRWRERVRKNTSKWPNPSECSILWKCEQLPANDSTCCQSPANDDNCTAPTPSPSPSPTPRERVRFAPPTLDQVKLHGAKIGLPVVECEKFISYYESNGWHVGRNGMKSWQAAMVHWRTNWQERAGPESGVRQPAQKTYRTITDDAISTINKFKLNP